MKSLSKVFGWVSFNNAAALMAWVYRMLCILGSYLIGPVATCIYVVSIPVLIAVASTSLLTAIICLATWYVIGKLMLKHLEKSITWNSIRFLSTLGHVGLALALNWFALGMPVEIVAIITLCLSAIGIIQMILFKGVFMMVFQISDHNDFNLFGYIFLFLVAIFSALLVVVNFGTLMIWLPLISCSVLTHIYVKDSIIQPKIRVNPFVANGIRSFLLIGVVSMLIQFNPCIFGMRVWALIVAVLFFLTLIVIFDTIQTNYRRKKYAEKKEKLVQEKAEREAFKSNLAAKKLSLTCEDILSGYSEIDVDFAVQLFSQAQALDFSKFVSVSNEKENIVWRQDMINAFAIMRHFADHTEDDEQLRKIIHTCASIYAGVIIRKTKDDLYEGEKALEAALDVIQAKCSPKKSKIYEDVVSYEIDKTNS